jgi:hypothetical protein
MKVTSSLIKVAIVAIAMVVNSSPASAQPPPGFPDLSGFTPVDGRPYEVAERTGGTQKFSTEDGIRCSINGYTSISCSTPFPLPGTTSGTTDNICTSVGPNNVPLAENDPHPYHFTQSTITCTSDPPEKKLPNGSKINYDAQGKTYFTCAADTNLVACIDDHQHGFVLQPTRSWTF